MIDRRFWEAAKNAWCVSAQPEIVRVTIGTGGKIDESLLKKPWAYEEEEEEISFDALDSGKPAPKQKPLLDAAAFDDYIAKKDLPSYVECCKLLMECDLPEEMEEIYTLLADKMRILQEAIQKFQKVYSTDMTEFYEYYIPEALHLTTTYLEYENAGIDEEIVETTKSEVYEAARSLLTAVNDKIDEIYKFASIEIQAQAKALAQLMEQDGFVNPSDRIK